MDRYLKVAAGEGTRDVLAMAREGLRANLRSAIQRAKEDRAPVTLTARPETAATQVASLTARQRQILDLVLAGHPSKNTAADLGISQRTVDNHRAAIMKKKTGSKSFLR